VAGGVSTARRFAIGLAAAAALLALVGFGGSAYLASFVFTVLISFTLAQSWDWVGGEMGYVNLGHFAFYGVGAYTFCILLTAGAGHAASFAAAVATTALLAAVLALPLFRLKGDYFAFATLAVVPLCELLAYNLSDLTHGGDGIVLPPHYVLRPAFAMAGVLAVAAVCVTVLLTRSRFGYALKAIRNDEQAAEVVGVRLFPAKQGALVLSAAFAGLAGAIQAWQLSFIDPPTVFGLGVALVPVAMALLGGSGLLWGPLVGVILLACAQQWLLTSISMLQATIYGAVILLIGRFLPGGILRAGALRRIPFLAPLAREHHERIARRPARALPQAGLPLEPLPVDRERVVLECRNVTLAFGGLVAVNDVSLSVRQGEIIGLVGPNGSGKTTLFNLISRVYAAQSGDIRLDGIPLAGLRRDEVARLGIGRTYQIPRPFADLTVRENIATALMFRSGGMQLGEAMTEAEGFAAFTGLAARLDERADALRLQERKALELARALACRPKLLLIDEVASGLTPAEVKRFVQHIREIRDRYGVTVIWVEHIFSALAQVVDRLVVLEQGRVIADGPLAEAMRDERVLKTYLGAAGAAR
jgi:branched-chain amino acid transport system permease protein